MGHVLLCAAGRCTSGTEANEAECARLGTMSSEVDYLRMIADANARN